MIIPAFIILICQLLNVAVIPIYLYLGYRLKENMLRWGFMGFGAMVILPLLCLPVLYYGGSPRTMLMFWSLVQAVSPVFALSIAGFIAYKKRLFNKSLA